MARLKRRLALHQERDAMPITDLAELERQYIAYHRLKNHSEKTIIYYRDCLKDFRRFLESVGQPLTSESLTSDNAAGFSRWLLETPTKLWRGKTERSIFGAAGRLRALRAFVGWLMDREIVTWKVVIHMPKLPETEFQIFSDEELIAIFSAPHLTASGPQAVRNRALVALLLDTGIRLGELTTLSITDVEMADCLIKVTGKGRKARRVPFSSRAADHLKAWLRIRGKEEGNLFLLSYDGTRQLLKRIQKETGIHIFTHKFRHQAATMLVRNNVDIHAVKRIMGHANIATTEIYLSLSSADLRAKHNAGSPLQEVDNLLPKNVQARKRRRLDL